MPALALNPLARATAATTESQLSRRYYYYTDDYDDEYTRRRRIIIIVVCVIIVLKVIFIIACITNRRRKRRIQAAKSAQIQQGINQRNQENMEQMVAQGNVQGAYQQYGGGAVPYSNMPVPPQNGVKAEGAYYYGNQPTQQPQVPPPVYTGATQPVGSPVANATTPTPMTNTVQPREPAMESQLPEAVSPQQQQQQPPAQNGWGPMSPEIKHVK